MDDAKTVNTLSLVAISADGTAGEVLARVIDGKGIGAAGNGGEPPRFALLRFSDAGEETLLAALADGAAGIVLAGPRGWDDVERVAMRLSVIESSRPSSSRGIALLAMADGAASALALGRAPPRLPRLLGIGLDAGGLTGDGTETAATQAARGLIQLAAAAVGVPAFERLSGPATQPALTAIRSSGFAWALVPEAVTSA